MSEFRFNTHMDVRKNVQMSKFVGMIAVKTELCA